MKRSLRRRLTLMLGGAILLSGLAAALASFILAYSEAKEFQDHMLRQIALLASSENTSAPAPPAAQTNPARARRNIASRITVVRLPDEPRPDWLAGELAPGFHTLAAGNGRLRVYVLGRLPGRVIVVAQPTDIRDEITLNSALLTLAPLLLLLPVMAWLVVRIVRSELAPVGRLATHLDAQPADRPLPLSDADVPVEITPFVDAINRLLARVGELISQQRRFIADAAHELRSPLTALSVQAANLKQAATLEAMRARVAPLEAGIERARKLTEQLLSLARTQAGPGATAVSDASAMARELIAEYLPAAEAKGIDLGLDESAPLMLSAEPDTLRLVLRNGLDNALKYAPEGGEVTLRLYRNDDSNVIEIVDNGPGIPASAREHAFDPFFRLPGAAGEGSGLGLAIARQAADNLCGRLSLHERADGPGLIFRYRQGDRP